MKNTLFVKVLSQAQSVPGQGVGSAYHEQIRLISQSKIIKIHQKKNEPIDLIHIHTINLRYWFILKWTKKPTVVYVHLIPSTLNTSIKLPQLFFGILKWYIKWFYRLADYLVVVNPSFIDPLMGLGIAKEKIYFIPNYVDEQQFKSLIPRNELREKYQFNRFTVLGVGQVQHRKGVLDFIACANRLPELDFVWAGGFSFKGLTYGYEELKKIMENPPKNVRFLGIIPREAMKDVYAAADVFFLPSLDELMPMSVLEAAVSDKPTLLRDLSLYEPVFFNHYLKAHSVDEFVRMIKRLAEDPLFYQAASKQALTLKLSYQKEHILRKWEQFYQEVVTKYAQTH